MTTTTSGRAAPVKETVTLPPAMAALQKWRNADHDDRIVLSRDDVIMPIEEERSALLQARADAAAEAAQALMVERAVDVCARRRGSTGLGAVGMCEAEIRDLASVDGLALVAELRERAEKAEQERVAEWNRRRDADGSRDAARAACDTMRAERDTLAAELAQADLRAKNAYMRGLLDSAQHLRSTIPDNPDSWEQVESMARMLDALAHRAAAKAVAG